MIECTAVGRKALVSYDECEDPRPPCHRALNTGGDIVECSGLGNELNYALLTRKGIRHWSASSVPW